MADLPRRPSDQLLTVITRLKKIHERIQGRTLQNRQRIRHQEAQRNLSLKVELHTHRETFSGYKAGLKGSDAYTTAQKIMKGCHKERTKRGIIN